MTSPNESTASFMFGVIVDLFLFITQVIWEICLGTLRLIIPAAKKSIKDEVVLITGAGHGIGKELALQYASNGATVVGWDINADALKDTVAKISEMNYPKAYAYTCNVTDRADVMKAAERVKREVGFVSILVNNAGVLYSRLFLEQTVEEIERTISVNLMAHFWTLQAFLPNMVKRNHGHIVTISSAAGLAGGKHLSPYCASKFAVRGLIEALHLELLLNPKNNVKFTTIYPYLVNTGLFKRHTIRFRRLLPILKTEYVAKCIIDAQRSDVIETSIPGNLLGMLSFVRLFPAKIIFPFIRLLGSHIDPDN